MMHVIDAELEHQLGRIEAKINILSRATSILAVFFIAFTIDGRMHIEEWWSLPVGFLVGGLVSYMLFEWPNKELQKFRKLRERISEER